MPLMPWLMFGALLAVIPVIVHLLHKQKTTPVAWGAMQFLLETSVSQRRKRRIDHWLLMLVRIAVLVLMALLLARPVILQSKYNPLATSTAADIAVVIDHSLSMGRRTGSESLFEQGLGQLDKIVATMRPADSLSIVLAEHTARRITPLPTSNAEEIQSYRAALRQLKPGMTDASIPDAVLAAKDLVNRGRNIRKIVLVISDEQRSGWQPDNETAWRTALGDRENGPDKDVQVFDLPVAAATSTPNVAVTGLTVGSGLIGLNRPVAIMARVANVGGAGTGDMPGFPVRLIVDGQPVGTQQVPALAAGQSHTVRFDHFFNAAGSRWVAVQAEVVDSLEADNRMVAAVNVWDKLPVLVVDGVLTEADGFGSSAFLQAAMQPEENRAGENTLIQPKVVSVSEAARTDLEAYPVVVFNDVPRLPAAMVARVAEYVQAGHGAWFILGPRTEAAFVNNTLGKTALFPAKVGSIVKAAGEGGSVPGIVVKDPDHGSVALLTAAERNALTGVAVTAWWKLEGLADTSRVVLASSAAGNDPLVISHPVGQNGGRVVVWTTSADGQWNNLPVLGANFVPLVNETLFYLATGTSGPQARRLEAGQTLVWTGPATPQLVGTELVTPEGKALHPQPQLVNGKYVVSSAETFAPGLYELKFTTPRGATNPPPVYYSVNIDRRELDPALLEAGDVDRLKEQKYLKDRVTLETLPAAIGAENRGTELWPYAALLVLGLLVWETYLTRRAVGLQAASEIAEAGVAGRGAA